jgi:hypothetical protein
MRDVNDDVNDDDGALAKARDETDMLARRVKLGKKRCAHAFFVKSRFSPTKI